MGMFGFADITNTARIEGRKLIENPILPSPATHEEAYKLRQVYVPILYKLGYTKEAADLDQLTFEFLCPELHQSILTMLHRLFKTNDLVKLSNEISYMFSINDENVTRVYSRLKSTNSIWKKIKSEELLQTIDLEQFALLVDDFIAVRWNMKVKADENRYDALINGLRLVPKENITRFRNQQVAQSSGFSGEPVMKLYYIFNGLPVELQLLGGRIEEYMCAKGYANYKVGHSLSPEGLTAEEQDARLGLCIYYAENNLLPTFRQLMLNELTAANTIHYDANHTFHLDSRPINQANLTLCFSGEEHPIYTLPNYTFPNHHLDLGSRRNLSMR
jgi:hypothetical protein